MNAKRAGIVFIAAGLAIAGSVWLSSQRHLERSFVGGELVLPELKAQLNAITDIRLIKAGGVQTNLHRGDVGWSVVERNYPADSSKVRKLLLDLAGLEVIEEKTSDPANYPEIGVQDVTAEHATATRVDFTAGGKTSAILLGNASGAKSGFVRVPSAARSFLATPRPATDAEPAQWLDHTLMSVPERRIKQASFSGPGGSYSIAREKPEQANFSVTGVPRNRKLSGESAGNASATGLDSLTLDDVRSPAGATPAETARASFTTFDGLRIDATGHAEGDRRYVIFSAKSSTKDQEHEADTLQRRFVGHEFEIPPYKYNAIFRPLDDLLEKPTEPQATAPTAGPPPAAPSAGAQ